MNTRRLAVALAGAAMMLWVPAPVGAQDQMKEAGGPTTAARGGVEVQAKHGRTFLDYPSPLFFVVVDENGKFIPSAGTIRVSHSEDNLLCHKVNAVSASSGPQIGAITFAGGAGLCNFTLTDGTIRVPWSPDRDAYYAGLCTPERRMGGWSGMETYHTDVVVALRYNSGEEDRLAGAQRPTVSVGCRRTTCTTLQLAVVSGNPLPEALAGKPYSTRLFAGGSAPVRYEATGLPPGLSLRDGVVSGTPTTSGTYPVSFTAADGCPVAQKLAVTASLKVRDTQPPAIAAFSVTPDTLASSGGDVTLMVQASDNIAVGKIFMTTKHPDGHTGSAQLPLVSGTAANGTWKLTFPLPLNSQPTPVAYEFTVSASDLDLNGAKAGPKTVVISAHADPRLPPALRR